MASLVNLVCMGDSITFGQCVDPSVRWSSLVHQHFDQRFRTTDIHLQVINKGISGETTRMGLERFPADVQNQNPDIMTLQFGLNDCNCWLTNRGLPRVSEAAYEANLIEMIDRARLFGAKHIILSTNHRTVRYKPQLSGEPYEESNARYSEIIRGVAKKTKVTLCDIRKAFEPYSDSELEELLIPYPDHLHLSVKGNEVYAQTILPLIEKAVNDVLKKSKKAAA